MQRARISTRRSSDVEASRPFLGWRVVAGAFVLAAFGWGLGFYGPPIYLQTVREARGWSVTLISAAVTTHYLVGAALVANLPRLYARYGLPSVTRAGAVALAAGLLGWAEARAPWQLFAAALLSGCGWVTMGAAAVNAIVSPWFARLRPKALSAAYNGASVGGVIFSPLWVALIAATGFPAAAATVGFVAVVAVWALTATLFRRGPAELGQVPDGDGGAKLPAGQAARPDAAALPGPALWRSWPFRTLAAGMALGLFAQIGFLAHLFSLLAPALGAGPAGLALGSATASAIAGRTLFGWLMPEGGDRRRAAAVSYGIQVAGGLALLASGATDPWLIWLGVLLFGFGIGNATSLPPLIAQAEFAERDTPRVVALIVAIGQAAYALAPAVFGLLREGLSQGGIAAEVAGIALLAIAVQALAIGALLAGRRPTPALRRSPGPRS